MRKHLKKHKYKIVIAVPLIGAFLASANLAVQPINTLALTPQTTPFILSGETISLDLIVDVSDQINVIGSVLTYPKDLLEITKIDYKDSIINIWAQKPVSLPEFGIINFGGGIISDSGGFVGTSTVVNVTFKSTRTGIANIILEGSVLLAHDGTGENILTSKKDSTVYIREEGMPTPDVNEDGKITIADASNIYTHTFLDYNFKYDIDGDGEVSFSDVSMLFSLID